MVIVLPREDVLKVAHLESSRKKAIYKRCPSSTLQGFCNIVHT